MPDLQAIALSVQIIQFLWVIALTVYTLNGRGQAAMNSHIGALEKNLGQLSNEIAAMRGELHSRPSASGLNASFSEVYERINAMDKTTQDRINAMDKTTQDNLRDLTGKLGEIKGALSAVGPSLALLNQFALETKRNG